MMKLVLPMAGATVMAVAIISAIGHHSSSQPMPPMPRPKPVPETIEPPEILQPRVVRSIPIEAKRTPASDLPVVAALPKHEVVEDNPPPPPRRRYRRPDRRADLCARHGLRKVDYGRTWRCRR